MFGEVGLAGEIRPGPARPGALARGGEARLHPRVIPAANKPRQAIDGIAIVAVERIDQALQQLSA